MRRGMKVLVVVVGVLLAVWTTVAFAGGRPLSTTMSGAEEVPAGAGDPDGVGTADLRLNAGQERVCYDLAWENLDGVVFAAHIHRGVAGENGPIVVTLFEGEAFAGTASASGCDTGDATRAVIKEILKDPSGFYVNVHDSERPAGAIRGQLSRR